MVELFGIGRRTRVRLRLWLAALCMAIVATWGLSGADVSRAQDLLPAEGDAVHAQQLVVPATKDTYIQSYNNTVNFGDEDELHVSIFGFTGAGSLSSGTLLQFDLPAFPAATTFTTANMRLYQTSSDDQETWQLPVSRIAGQWAEDTVTYLTRPDTVTSAVSVTAAASDGVFVNTDISSLVTNWVAGVPGTNYGLMISYSGGEPRERIFASRESSVVVQRPVLELVYTLPPVRVCVNQNDTCPVAANAIVHNLTTGAMYQTDDNGYISSADLGTIAVGDELWARMPFSNGDGGILHAVQGEPVAAVNDEYLFVDDSQELRLVVNLESILRTEDLNISAQWYVQGDSAAAQEWADRIVQASAYLYAFTEGQFALGNVNVYQDYTLWESADMRLHANNTLRPRAYIGGKVEGEVADFDPAIPVTYTTGPISMGSYWNRFGSPPNAQNLVNGEPYPETLMEDDWSLALAHELGHWLLFLFDTYTGVDGTASVELAELCTGTAMGNVYAPVNHGYIANVDWWDRYCSETEAYDRLGGRTEWATISGWYPWVTIPSESLQGPESLPVGVTTVTFVAPANTPGDTVGQLFDLEYQNGETSSGEARAFLMRNDRVIEQGKPAKGTTQVQLTGAQVGDRLCVYDINDFAEGDEVPRHQFGCEIIEAGDATLVMTRDQTWSPQIALTQIGADQVQVIVTTTLPASLATQLRVRLYPEHESGMDEVALQRSGAVYSATIVMAGGVPPLFAQVYVNESPTAPQTRREVIADRGTGGGGAFGPARLYGDVLVMSSDGNASFEGEDALELQPGESIAWQSMPGTPPMPYTLSILGQSYRLDAYPPHLVEEGTVRIRYIDPQLTAAAAAPAEMSGSAIQIWFWNGVQWSALNTEIVTPVNAADGVRLASAPSAGVGVYAVMMPSLNTRLRYLPMIAVD